MNKFVYSIYRFVGCVQRFLSKRIKDEDVIKYKLKHNQQLTDGEELSILLDVDHVIYGEMSLSEYIEKRGTVYVDEKFWPLFKKEREYNKAEVKRQYKVLNTYRP